jgi:hypothetical protein
MENDNLKTESNNANVLLCAVDWKGISKTEINQISHEVRCWAKDYEDLQSLEKLLGQPIGRTFKDKFDEWMPNRIKMVLDRDNYNCT